MKSGLLSHDSSRKRVHVFALIFVLAAMVLALAPPGSSQQAYRPPTWSVQSADSAHRLLTLRGSVMVGVDSGMFYIVQFQIQGPGTSQLASFRPNMLVALETSGSRLQGQPTLGAKTGGKVQSQPAAVGKSGIAMAAFTEIPTVGQTLLIQGSGMSPVEGVVVSVTGPQSYTAGQPGPPCCTVTAVNYQAAFQAMIASAKVNASGQNFEFELRPPPPPAPPCDPLPNGSGCLSGTSSSPVSVKVGQSVWANLTTGQVSLDGKTPCCQIIAEGTSLSAGGKPSTVGGNRPVAKAPACCQITALNQQAKTASAKVNSNGQTFQIAIANRALLQSLHVGQAIWANFHNRQVSLNGLGPVDGMQIVVSAAGSSSTMMNVPGITIAGKKPLYTAIPSPSSPPLAIQDHTLIMQAFIQNSAYIRQGMSRHNWLHATRNQVAMGVMLYLIKANTVPEATKERVRVAFQTMRRMRFGPRLAADVAFHKQALAALRAASDPSSAVRTLSNLEQEHANEPKHAAALNLAKTLVNALTTVPRRSIRRFG